MRQATRLHGIARTRDGRASGGQSIVELALMLPVLVLLIAGIVDLGRIYYTYIAVINVAREGVRFAAANPPSSCDPDSDPDGIDAIVASTRREAEASKLNPAQLDISVLCTSRDVDSPIHVAVRYEFHPMLANILYIPPVSIHQDVYMQIFGR